MLIQLKFVIISFTLIFTTISCSIKGNSDINNTTDLAQHQSSENGFINIEKAIFTNPKLTSKRMRDSTILNSLVYYVNHTPGDAIIHISTMLFYYKPLVTATVEAVKRGVIVKVLMDGREGNKDRNQATFNKLMHVMKSPSTVKWVYNDAKGIDDHGKVKAINHEKCAIFSKVHLSQGVANNLVFATSHNFKSTATEQANDAIIMSNTGLYDAFLNNWNEMASRSASGMKDFTYTVANVGDSITAFFYPRRKDGEWDGGNTVVEQLQEKGYYMDTIRVLMAGWSGNGLRIAEKLTDLQEKGITVQVIARDDAKADIKAELYKMESKGGYLKTVNTKTQGEHSKTLIMKGTVMGEKQRIILTGSYNYSSSGLKYNNEFLLMLKNSTLFNAYWKNWDKVRQDFF